MCTSFVFLALTKSVAPLKQLKPRFLVILLRTDAYSLLRCLACSVNSRICSYKLSLVYRASFNNIVMSIAAMSSKQGQYFILAAGTRVSRVGSSTASSQSCQSSLLRKLLYLYRLLRRSSRKNTYTSRDQILPITVLKQQCRILYSRRVVVLSLLQELYALIVRLKCTLASRLRVIYAQGYYLIPLCANARLLGKQHTLSTLNVTPALRSFLLQLQCCPRYRLRSRFLSRVLASSGYAVRLVPLNIAFRLSPLGRRNCFFIILGLLITLGKGLLLLCTLLKSCVICSRHLQVECTSSRLQCLQCFLSTSLYSLQVHPQKLRSCFASLYAVRLVGGVTRLLALARAGMLCSVDALGIAVGREVQLLLYDSAG